MNRAIGAVLFGGAIFLGSCVAQAAEPAVRLLAVPETKGSYMVGEPIFLTLKFTVLSAKPITVCMGHLDRRALSVACAGRTTQSAFLETCPGGLSRIYRRRLQQGQTYEHRILLNEWVRFKEPGDYRVRIIYDGRAGVEAEPRDLRAECDFAFSIVPKDPEKLKGILKHYHDEASKPPFDHQEQDILALCYSGENEALAFLRRRLKTAPAFGTGISTELFKGLRRVGTPAALDLLSDLMNSSDKRISHMAMVEVGLLEKETTDPAVKARARELMKQIPKGFKFVEPTTICD